MSRLDFFQRTRTIGLENDQHIRDRVRHRILCAFRTTRAAHDVLDFGYLSQHVLDAVVQPIDFVQCGFRWQDGLQEERAFVQLRHEVATNAQAQGSTRDRHE